jgi:hypothetical protein
MPTPIAVAIQMYVSKNTSAVPDKERVVIAV